MTIRRARVGDILNLRRERVEVEPSGTYREIGVRSFGRGLFIKDPADGAALGDKRVFRVRMGDLVVSNVFAWEGAVAVAGSEHDELIGSHRFMTWVPRADDVSVDYLRHYFASERGLESLRRASPGSAGRNRTLSINNFEAIEVPLPPVNEQRRIASHLDRVGAAVAQINPGSRVGGPADSVQAAITAILTNYPLVALGELAEVNPGTIAVPHDTHVAFVPMAAVSASAGTIVQAERRSRGDLKSGYKQFLSGDLIFARITPCMQNGKVAIYDSEDFPIAYGSTEFHVVRAPAVLALWIHQVLRSRWFIDQAISAFTGTAGQQRVPAEFLRNVRIPVPADIPAATAAVARLRKLELEAREVGHRCRELALAVLPAARNEIFSAMQ